MIDSIPFLIEGTVSPIVLDNATTLLLVLQENTFHFTVDLSVINESVGFEIVFEAAKVEVGRAYRT